MFGAIIGDIVGSRFERYNHRTKDFEFFGEQCRFTDDTVMSLAICKALLESKSDFSDLDEQAVNWMQTFGRIFKHRGYGKSFGQWIYASNPQPYNSFGNGAAMRVSGCGYVATSIEEAKKLSKAVTEVTHNHPEGLKGAEATAVAVFLARTDASKSEIREYISQNYYDIDFNLDDIRDTYRFNVTCQGSVPQALEAFFESTNFEDAIRNAISIGGDSDTIAAITGAIAEAYYGITVFLRQRAGMFLDTYLFKTIGAFENKYPAKIIDGEEVETDKKKRSYAILKNCMNMVSDNENGAKVNEIYDSISKNRKFPIRPARETDLSRINDIKQQIQTIHHTARPDLYTSNVKPYNEEDFRDPNNPFILFLVATDAEDKATGFIYCDTLRYSGEYEVPHACLYVMELGVDEKYRRQGIGSQLLERAYSHAKHKGYNSIDLGVDASQADALRFYARNGFSSKYIRMEKIMR